MLKIKKRLLILFMIVLFLPSMLLSPALSVDAASSDLYGSGSADEINIIRLLDMALNKGGMSMSPATIQSFLDFWWASVQSDLNTCISNADAAITTTQDFVDYVYTALEDTEHYDQLGDIIKRYVRYVLTLDYKSLSDFKQLLTQQGTFRRFLLSYVTDQDGKAVSSVSNNKLAKYNLKSGFVGMVRQAADAYIEEHEGYFLVPTRKPSSISASNFITKESYEAVVNSFKTMQDDQLVGLSKNMYDKIGGFIISLLPENCHFVSEYVTYDGCVYLYNNNWDKLKFSYASTYIDNSFVLVDLSLPLDGESSSSDIRICNLVDGYSGRDFYSSSSPLNGCILYSVDGRSIKVWKSLDTFKASTLGKSNIYYSSGYGNFDPANDNGITFTGQYYAGSYSHDTIQNNIDNSETVNESTVNNIVNNYITNNNYGDSSGSGSGGSGDGSGSSGGWWNIGEGISAFFEGVAALLDFLLKLLGDLVGLIASFATSLLDILKSLSAVGSEFGDFFGELFSFLPPELTALITVSIGAVCAIGVLKMFKK